MRKIFNYLLGVVMIVVSACFIISCDSDNHKTRHYYDLYRSNIIKEETKSGGVTFKCQRIKILEFSRDVKTIYINDIHSSDCVVTHIFNGSNKADWNYFSSNNNDWMYNRKETAEYEFTFDEKKETITLSNGDIYHCTMEEKEGDEYIIGLYKDGEQYVKWDGIKPEPFD